MRTLLCLTLVALPTAAGAITSGGTHAVATHVAVTPQRVAAEAVADLAGPPSSVKVSDAKPACAPSSAHVRAFAPESAPFGRSMPDWTAAWWQWAFSIPNSVNPLLDTTGADCMVGQHGPVFYLAGVFNVSGTATRSCNVPCDRALFFPILNCENNNVEVTPPQTVPELRKGCADAFIDQITALAVEVDGKGLPNLLQKRNRILSPVFSYSLPEDNLIDFFGVPTPAETVSPVISDGYWVMLAPLPPGMHTVRIFGSTPSFTLDVLYNLNVTAD